VRKARIGVGKGVGWRGKVIEGGTDEKETDKRVSAKEGEGGEHEIEEHDPAKQIIHGRDRTKGRKGVVTKEE